LSVRSVDGAFLSMITSIVTQKYEKRIDIQIDYYNALSTLFPDISKFTLIEQYNFAIQNIVDQQRFHSYFNFICLVLGAQGQERTNNEFLLKTIDH